MADSYFSSVAMLAKFTTDGAVTTFTDTTGKTLTGYGDAKVVTSPTMLTGHALALDGSGDFLAGMGDNVVVLGSGPATIDCELIASGAGYIVRAPGASSSWGLYVDASGYVAVIIDGGGVKTGAIAINNGAKHHVAVVKVDSNNWSLYIDGIKDGASFSWGNAFASSTYFSIGAQYDGGAATNAITGQIGYVRVTPGVARWTANFTPPTLADLGAIYSRTMNAGMVIGTASAGRGVFRASAAEYFVLASRVAGIWFSRISFEVGISASHDATLLAVRQLHQALEISAGIASRAIFGESLAWALTLSSESEARLLALASVSESVRIYMADLNAGGVDDAIQTFVANLATSAHSRYAQYGFNSFAQFNGKRYGCKSDGVYELGGDTDGANPISWTVTLGETDFGMDAIKRLPYVYVAAKASGDLVLKVIEGPGTVHFFTVEMSSRESRAGRATLARGLSRRYWQIEIASDTERVELDALEFFPAKVSRRI